LNVQVVIVEKRGDLMGRRKVNDNRKVHRACRLCKKYKRYNASKDTCDECDNKVRLGFASLICFIIGLVVGVVIL